MNLIAILFVCCGTDFVGHSTEDIIESLRKAEIAFNKDVQSLRESYAEKVKQTQDKYVEERGKIDKQCIESMTRIRDAAAKNANLETANKAQLTIDELSKSVIVAPEVKHESPPVAVDFSGTWIGQWDNTNKMEFRINAENVLEHVLSETNSHRSKIVTKNGRALVLDGMWQDFELIRRGERLIVLGWTKKENLHPMFDQPDHVAILTKQK